MAGRTTSGGGAHFVVTEDYVTAEDGTGLVHQSPAFGEDDFRSCRRNDVAMVNPIDSRGRLHAEVPLVGGQFFRHANSDLVDDLSARGLLFRHVPYEHSYPHCWRCHTALLYYAQPSWYIRTTQIKDALLRENEATNWHPSTIKHGRYGDWLENNIDWALSRSALLGHAAADLALRRRPPGLRRLAGRALDAHRRRPVRPRPAPALRGRRGLPLPDLRRARRAGCRR